MNLDEAWGLLGGEHSSAAWEFIRGEVRRMARKWVGGAELDDVVQDVCFSLVRAQRRGTSPDNLEGYIWRAVKNKACSSFRKKRSRPEVPTADGLEPESPSRFGAEQVDELLRLMERVLAHTASRRTRARGNLELAFRQIMDTTIGCMELTAVVERDEGVDPEDASAWSKAMERTYKAHKRCRGHLLDSLDVMESETDLTREEADLARRFLSAPHVSRMDGQRRLGGQRGR